jgi:hypothetical protein
MNWFINRQDSGSTASHTDADGGVTGSQSPVQSGAAEGTQAQGNGWIHRSRALFWPLEFPDALLEARPPGLAEINIRLPSATDPGQITI